MNEEAPKITSVEKTPREKNPGRVAAGKRLAAISKEAKEHKKLEQAVVTGGTAGLTTGTAGVNSSVILVGGLVVAGGSTVFPKVSQHRNRRRQRDAKLPKDAKRQ